ncbi:hypothetical protein LOCC1_G004346 [Lachnellula occidentalis]|uniref:Aminoglycoside phosphotransferase domain-containing protein n=1 Tax=Lachnellula occidentalis TaxID=215460 RepID=A0A8H8UIA1_9HELO|nr:hypothetical protein LOCC1_G004346 [Lachnellula occidentalis]
MGTSFSKNSKGTKSATRTQSQAAPQVHQSSNGDGSGKAFSDPEARDEIILFPLDGRELSSVSDQELTDMLSTAPKLHQYGAVTIVRLSKYLALKGGRRVSPSEARNMIFAADSLHLPVPKVHRSFTADIPAIGGMGKVKGFFISVATVSDMSQRESVTSQVVTIINNMQSTTLELPSGPVGATADEKFEGPWFTEDGAGPYATMQDLENWYNHKIDICIQYQQLPPDATRFKFDRLVLTHQDIASRNLILDAQSNVWMIDWGIAGVYPPGFEQAVLAGTYEELTDIVLARLEDRGGDITKQYRSIGYGLSVAARL